MMAGQSRDLQLPAALRISGRVERVADLPDGRLSRIWRARVELAAVDDADRPARTGEGEARDNPAAAVRRAVVEALAALQGLGPDRGAGKR